MINGLFDDIDSDLNYFNQLHDGVEAEFNSEYFVSDTFNRMTPLGANSFSLIHLNIRSLLPKLDDFQAELNTLNCTFDVICFTESWLNRDTVCLAKINVNEYNDFHSCRADRRGGGVSVYIRKKYKCKNLTKISLNCDYIESVFLELSYGNTYILVGTVYRPPNTSYPSFEDRICEALSVSFICGDFNIDVMNSNCHLVDDFMNMMQSHALLPSINKPTRISENSATLIDNIFISCHAGCSSGVLVSNVSDHLPYFCLCT